VVSKVKPREDEVFDSEEEKELKKIWFGVEPNISSFKHFCEELFE